jgi:hypothetical protein
LWRRERESGISLNSFLIKPSSDKLWRREFFLLKY